jgi:hypothetical protein
MFMNRILSRLQNLLLSQVMVIFLVGSMFFGLQSFDYGQPMLLAQVDSVKTPEGIYYKATPDEDDFKNGEQMENARQKLRETGDMMRERLNLNEETPEATKEFLKSVQNKVDETVEPITGAKRGYYQEIPPQREAEK